MLIVHDIKMRRKEEVKTTKKKVQPLLTLSLNTIVSHLTEKVIDAGYDPTEFAQFLEYKMEGGTNVDNWEFQALMAAVDEF